MATKKSIIEKIKQKPELKGLSNKVISEALDNYSRKHKIQLEKISKPQDLKIIIKQIRAFLRDLTGQFLKSQKNREVLFKKNKIKEILQTHASTSERLDFYPRLKKIISNLEPNSILDLGCGLNPLALSKKGIKYYASDIKEDELEIVKKFFEKNKIEGKTFIQDLRNDVSNLPEADLCILFKVLDVIEKKSHKFSENILKTVKCKYFLVSFATKKLSGKSMKSPRRVWFEKIIEKLNYSYKKFDSNNEIFYLCTKE